MITRRSVLQLAAKAAAVVPLTHTGRFTVRSPTFPSERPPIPDRRFRAPTVEQYLTDITRAIPDAELAWLFNNCFPNTLDTTILAGVYEGKPDTAVITGDIAAMWLRDSSAQVWPYLPLAKNSPELRKMLEGIIRRQARCILIDPYANAFMADLNAPPLPWSVNDDTDHFQGVGERKWELDSLCYPMRLSFGYWEATGNIAPFDSQWAAAMKLSVKTMRVQQRKNDVGPYHFQRPSPIPTETLSNGGFGALVRPTGLIASGFRPSDDACTFPFLVPSNLFAVTALGYLAQLAHIVLKDDALANDAQSLADEVERALRQHALARRAAGNVWSYEIDGFGNQLFMDDANVPSLLSLPYLRSSPDKAIYARTRAFVWSTDNPWFFKGSAGEGIGGPHVGPGMIWPMSLTMYALTSDSPHEILQALRILKRSSANSGFIHESFREDDSSVFTRKWFAWANSLFGELVATTATSRPEVLKAL